MNAKKAVSTIAVLAVIAGLLAWAFWPDGKTPSSRKIVVGSWGGAYQTAQRKAFFEPFMAKTSMQITETSTPDYGKIYEWQRSGTASADVLDVETFFVFQAGPKGALAPIDRNLLPKNLMEGAVTDFGVASCAYAEIVAWNSQTFPDASNLNWSDFWDTAKYPGPRGLRDLPATGLEAALMADGVSPKDLYPLDVDRAFRKLDELRNSTRIILWSSGSKPVELLRDGTVALSTAWNGRIYDARHEGLPLAMSFNQATLDWLWWVIPANAANKKESMEFIAFTLQAESQKLLALNIPYGPTNSDAWSLLDEESSKALANSPQNMDRIVVRDNKWWAEHEQTISDRWREWKLKLEQ